MKRKARVDYAGYALHGRVVEILDETSVAGISCWLIKNPSADGEICLPKDRLRIIKGRARK